ncbi:MAG TPA: acyltransferase [Bacteroidia bacterium]|jgi:peptidoglycan/LPS O-acetylase OafA/YrhL
MQRLPVINGLRGYAILGVIYFHLLGVAFNQPGWMNISIGNITIMPLTYLSNGWVGVNLFFMLSGFVLYLPYAAGSRNLDTGREIRAFFKNRAARLFPLYYIALVISIIFILHQTNIYDVEFWKQTLLMFTFTFNFTKETFIPPHNYVLWSLGIEVLFSLVFPFLVLLINRWNMRTFVMGVFIMSLVVRIISHFYPEYIVAPHLNMIKDSLPGRLDDFAAGMLICHLWHKGWKAGWFRENAEFLFLLSLVVITLGFYFSDYIFLKFAPAWTEPLLNNVFHIGFAMITFALLYMQKNILRFLFTNRFLQLSGMMCYSLYLWHGNMRWFFIMDYSVLRVSCYLFFLFLLSFLTYRYIEFGNKKLNDILPE